MERVPRGFPRGRPQWLNRVSQVTAVWMLAYGTDSPLVLERELAADGCSRTAN